MNIIESVSKRSFRSSSGTYNVQALEVATAKEQNKLKSLNVTVHFLDETAHVFSVTKNCKGSFILEQVCHHLELVEKDYFGLQYSENQTASHISRQGLMRWLDPSKTIKKQLKNCQHILYFRVKFYVSDPSKLQEEYTRYQFCLQIRRDILERKLILAPSTAILLGSYTVQAELGDYQPHQPAKQGPTYISSLQLVPEQSHEMENKIIELHKLHRGQTPAEAEFNFLDYAKKIDMYGVELHNARDNANKEIQLGVTHLGLLVCQNNVKINTFSWSKIMKISFKRKHFFIQLIREASENYDTMLGFNLESYRSSKALWKSCVEHHTFFRLHSPKIKRKLLFSLGSKFSYSGRTEFQTVSELKRCSKLERKFIRSPSKRLIQSARSIQEEGSISDTPVLPSGRPSRCYDNKVTSLGTKVPKKAWGDEPRLPDDDGGFLEKALDMSFSVGIAGHVLNYVDEEVVSPTSTNELYDTPPYSVNHSPTPQVADECLTTITLYPEDGKYGFNVKGGTTKDVPVLVSRVAPNTPADKCTPRLSEGDQLIQINSIDVSHSLHSDVIRLIQKARSTSDGKLVLLVKPDALYGGIENFEEPPYQYVPAENIKRSSSPENALEQSMLLLADGLASGALVAQFEMLYRKHPDLTCQASLEPRNINKNRYRDISPYDSTRVILNNGRNGDYINANYVTMKIGGTDRTNRYIATQGPLQSTSEDFWQMVLEEKTSLIVMLTTVSEKGRAKCYKYWPNKGECLSLPNMVIKCTREETEASEDFIFRDFSVTDTENKVTWELKHMQYLSWPDHGVPNTPAQFLYFTKKVRQTREDELTPVVVHCSAGIGRTGVLIVMETALCLMDLKEPIYPLEIVKTMREQRPMMIQSASQYRFVCESIRAAYLELISESWNRAMEVKIN